jgi:hypothetical protein
LQKFLPIVKILAFQIQSAVLYHNGERKEEILASHIVDPFQNVPVPMLEPRKRDHPRILGWLLEFEVE